MTDPERAAFVEWFDAAIYGKTDMEKAELAAECIWNAVVAERLKWMDRYEKDKANVEPIPWRASRPAEPTQPCHHSGPACPYCHWRALRDTFADCERIARKMKPCSDCARVIRELHLCVDRSVADAIAARRKEVCGE